MLVLHKCIKMHKFKHTKEAKKRKLNPRVKNEDLRKVENIYKQKNCM